MCYEICRPLPWVKTFARLYLHERRLPQPVEVKAMLISRKEDLLLVQKLAVSEFLLGFFALLLGCFAFFKDDVASDRIGEGRDAQAQRDVTRVVGWHIE